MSCGQLRAPLIVRTSSVTVMLMSLREVPAIGASKINSSFVWKISTDNCPTLSSIIILLF